MRIFSISSAICLLLVAASAAADNPVSKGSLVVEGEFGLSVTGVSSGDEILEYEAQAIIDDDETLTIISFSPSVGYFISNGVMLGGKLWFERWSIGNAKITFAGIGPSVAYFFNASSSGEGASGKVYPYIKGELMYVNLSLGSGRDDIGTIRYGGGGGILYMISNTVGLNTGLDFMFLSQSVSGDSNSGWNMRLGAGVKTFIY